MNQPVLADVGKVLEHPEAPASKKALANYYEAKKPAEELLRKQREWQDAKHPRR